jgi:hypothetical protein
MDIGAVEAFRLLGIPRDSDHDAIAHAYRRLARSVHPDVSMDADAAQQFASLAEAYRIARAAPSAPETVASGEAVPVRRPSGRLRQDSPIVAGPVYVQPHEGGGALHG